MKSSLFNRAIELDNPDLGALEKQFLIQCIDSTFVSTYGPFVNEFEEEFSKFLGIPHSVSVQSGTAGLHLAFLELGIGKGDEVIVPVITFAATANAVAYTGATPVFADVDPLTWTMTPETIEKHITSSTRAIAPVHLYGNPCHMDGIISLAEKYNLYIVEDAAESLGSRFNGRYTGTFGTFGVFSFNGNKLITTGGGGMVIGNDSHQLEHIRFLANQAKVEKDGYFHPEIGYNYRLTNLEASLGIAQIKRIREFIAKKKIFRKIYEEKFMNIDEIQLQNPLDQSDPVWWMNSVTLTLKKSHQSLSQIQAQLKNLGIPTRRIFIPLVEFPHYKASDKSQYKSGYFIYYNGINLPSSTTNDEDLIAYVADQLVNIIIG